MQRIAYFVSALMLGSCAAACTPAMTSAAIEAGTGCLESIIRSRLFACAGSATCESEVRTAFAAECEATPELCETSTIAGPPKP